jgi:hypothetical protein
MNAPVSRDVAAARDGASRYNLKVIKVKFRKAIARRSKLRKMPSLRDVHCEICARSSFGAATWRCTDIVTGLWMEASLGRGDPRLIVHAHGMLEGQALTAARDRHAKGQ